MEIVKKERQLKTLKKVYRRLFRQMKNDARLAGLHVYDYLMLAIDSESQYLEIKQNLLVMAMIDKQSIPLPRKEKKKVRRMFNLC